MRLRHLALPAAAGLTLLAVPFAPTAVAATAPVCADNACTVGFAFSGQPESFTVPAGVTNLAVALVGAQGGNSVESNIVDAATTEPGRGAAQLAIVPVTPGETLTVVVGGRGADALQLAGTDLAATPAANGYGGGGAAGPISAGGGGGTFLFGPSGLLLAAGGGGGAGNNGIVTGDPANPVVAGDTSADGGNGGAAAGSAAPTDLGGGGATTTGGGAPGAGDFGVGGTGPATGPAAFGTGGAGTGSQTCAAGAGGGGYFGGGSGGCRTSTLLGTDTGEAAGAAPFEVTSGGGGGGSGYAATAAGVAVVSGPGTAVLEDGNGLAEISYSTAATTTTLATSTNTLAPGQEATLRAKVDGPSLTITDGEAQSGGAQSGGAQSGSAQSGAAGPAAAAAKAAFGSAPTASALAVPAQPATPGTTITPGTACGTTPCTVTFFVNGTQLGNPINVDPATGVATVVFTAGSDLGVRTITARYDGNLYYLQSTSNPVTIAVAGLANTGVENVAPMLGSAAALLVVGAGLVAFGRRRPQVGTHRV